MTTITTQELNQKLQNGPLAMFDVRGDVLFEQDHIPGARTAPLGSLVFRIAGVMNKGSEVVIYSDGDGCDLAQQAAERLEKLGMTNIVVYADGMQGWHKAGQMTEQSVGAKQHTWGPVKECRHIVVDMDNAYAGAFKNSTESVEGAGG